MPIEMMIINTKLLNRINNYFLNQTELISEYTYLCSL